MGGYMGKLAWIDLSNGTVRVCLVHPSAISIQ
jgi:hypothetical protein